MRCGGCGQENPSRAKFCLECGSPLLAPAPAGSGESRRTVTVVFADMVGFTSLGESLDQESLRRVMDRFYAEMRGAIEAEAGTLAKFIGDAVLAVWGTPEVREDDALRAVRAADAMRRALSGLNEDLQRRWGVRVGMRTGVNTGEVVVDPTRPADLLVGDTLNVAARLEQAAADGEVLLGPETWRLVRDHTILEPVAPLALKGKAKPMPAWRVVDARTGGRRPEERLQAPLVGRAAEIAALRAAFDDVVASSACRMTTVIGSPGLGKTRLVSEFVGSVSDEAFVLHGRCQATGEGITFQPVAEVLRGAAGIEDDDTPESARTKLASMLPVNEPDGDRIVERAASLLGLGPAASTEETFWAVRRVLEALARERPVVLVHDDIHWGQPTFLDLLEHFAEWIRDAPVLVIALARPELREVRPGLAEGALALEPLDAEASRAMVSGLLGAVDLPEGLARRVLETTEGNPLFLGEMLRMLADEGVLQRAGDTWVAGNLTDVTVPPTISALLSARIQRLGPDERSVVERAAVIGHAFYRGAVTELAPAPVKPQVDAALDTLGRREMVRLEDEWWLDEQVFRFHHVLIRDAAYRSLLKEARAELHERFAGWLEQKAGELAGEHEEVIAFHLEQAHAYRLELGPLDAAGRDLAARAGRRLHSAGRRALAREDLPAAANLLRRALVPLEDDAVRLEVLVDLCESLLSAGDTSAAEPVVEALGLGAAEAADNRLRARALVFALQLDNLTGAGHLREAADAAAKAATTLAAAGDRAGEAKAHQVVAQAEALLGQVAAAETALDQALVAARAADDRRRITAVLSGAPRAALWGPAPIVRASGRCLDVVRILRMTPGNRHVEAAALRSQAVLEAMRGRADAARGILETCRVTLEELGLTLELRETAVHAGIVELLAGDPAAAESHLRAAHEGFRALGIESGAAQAAALLARALLAQDRDDEALGATRFAEQHGGEDLKTTVAWLGARAEVLARHGDHDQARTLAERAVALTEPTDALADKADAFMALAAVEGSAGDRAAARAAGEAARELYAAKDHSVGVALAEAVAGPGSAPQAPPAVPAERRREGGSAVRALYRLEALLNAKDWDGMRELYGAEGFRWIDRRSAGFFDEHGGAVLDGSATVRSTATIPEGSTWTLELLADSGDVAAGRMTSRGTGRKAGPWEVTAGLVCVTRDDSLMLCEALEDDRAGILARFEELRGPESPSEHHRLIGGFERAMNERDFGTLRSLFHDDFRQEDRRKFGADTVESADAFVAAMAGAMTAIQGVRLKVDVVAVAGERNLVRFRWSGRYEGAGGSAELDVWGSGTIVRGLTASMHLFDSEEEARAEFSAGPEESEHQRLNGRAAEGGGPLEIEVWGNGTVVDGRPAAPRRAGLSPVARMYAEVERGFNDCDWTAHESVLRDDYRWVDHRPGLRTETRTRDAFIAVLRGMREGQDLRWHQRHLEERAGGRVGLAHIVQTGTYRGGLYEIPYTVINVMDDRGLAYGVEMFAYEDPAADRRLEELALHHGLSNAVQDAINARDLDALRSLIAEDFHQDDHRALAAEPITTADAFVTMMADAFESVPDLHMRMDAADVANGRHLTRQRWTGHAAEGGGAMELDMWGITEVRAGRVAATHVFGSEEDARAAFERPGPDAPSPLERVYAVMQAGFNGCDWESLDSVLHEDYRWADHRPGLRAETRSRKEFVSLMREIREGRDLRWSQTSLEERADGRVGLSHVTQTGTYRGGPYEISFFAINVVDDEGRSHLTEVFAEDDPAAARLEELVAERFEQR